MNRSLRRLFWWWALLLASSIVLGWILGDWHSAWGIVRTVALIIVGVGLIYLIVAGFIELRNRERSED